MKWVEAKTLKDHITNNITKFLYKHVIIQFNCPRVNGTIKWFKNEKNY